ncbi:MULTISPECIES: cyclase family protein [Streptomyces]|uniref:cyclase family protein n=1 Tax=Streptomyces TaxID=1883 RepID=UPI000515B983|nr:MULTISPECIES: cyclase family protein [Streptomyces]MCX4486820.1 cyclase family protein [Streptomyces anulatus]WSI82065.1 cyclase family protein [Streptomyces anulatus]WTD14380.1 cyclase family protein [Streptomyces anulatus]WTE07690.1 cyclase family protein [Streptomyces anulatus]WTE30807.1 cyclase family protein [Streptomyces anulatus]
MTTRGAGKLVDLSHRIVAGMETYRGLPGPEISTHMSRDESRGHYAEGTEFHIGRISMVGNTGTYVDSPFHRFENGADLADLPLERLAHLPALRVSVDPSKRAIEVADLETYEVSGRAVLLHTGWDRHWGTEAYFHGHPYLTGPAAAWLVEQGSSLVGIDSLNIDDTDDSERPAHTTLLEAGVPVAEHLTGLEMLPEHGSFFSAVPAPVAGFATMPVRAYALLGE